MRLKRKLAFGMLPIVLLGAALAALSGHSGSSMAIQRLYSDIVSERDGVVVQRNVAYGTNPRHRLDIYHAADDDGSGPIVIFLYGGGWKRGDRRVYGFVGSGLASRGITTIIPDYRLFPEVKFPEFVDDAALVYDWTWRNYLSENARSRPIILAGHSAGAHMAALLSLDRSYLIRAAPDAPRPSAFISLAGPLAFDPTTWPTTRDIFTTVSNPDNARPVAFTGTGAPRSLLVYGLEDSIVKPWNTQRMAKALKKSGAPVRTIEYPGIGHIGLITAVSRPFRWRAPVLQEMVDFIRGVQP